MLCGFRSALAPRWGVGRQLLRGISGAQKQHWKMILVWVKRPPRLCLFNLRGFVQLGAILAADQGINPLNNTKRFFLLSTQPLKTLQKWVEGKVEMKRIETILLGKREILSFSWGGIAEGLQSQGNKCSCLPWRMDSPCWEKELFPGQINSLMRERCCFYPQAPGEIGLSKEILVWNWGASSGISGKWLKGRKSGLKQVSEKSGLSHLILT